MNVQDEIIEQAAKRLADDIDRGIIWSMLEELGWTRVTVTQNNNVHINIWAAKNCKGAYEYHDREYIFEDSKDANWFKLKWL